MAVDPIQAQGAHLRCECSTPSPGVALIALHGELDMATVPDLELAFMDAEATDDPVIVVDLRPLEFLDLAGARSLLAADGRARRSGRTLHVVAGPKAERLFALAQLDGLSVLD